MRVVVLLIAAFLISTGAASAKGLSVKTVPEKEIQTINASGQAETKRVLAEKVVPGDEVIYTIYYENQAQKPADNVVLTSPVPEHMSYSNGSAMGKSSRVTFSIDNGLSFAPWNNLYVIAENGQRQQAGPQDYTHVRWALKTPVSVGTQGSVSFKAVLN